MTPEGIMKPIGKTIPDGMTLVIGRIPLGIMRLSGQITPD